MGATNKSGLKGATEIKQHVYYNNKNDTNKFLYSRLKYSIGVSKYVY